LLDTAFENNTLQRRAHAHSAYHQCHCSYLRHALGDIPSLYPLTVPPHTCSRYTCVHNIFNETVTVRNRNRRAGIIEHKFQPSGVQAVYKVTVRITRTGLDAHIDTSRGNPIEGPPFEVMRYMRNVDWDIGKAVNTSGGTVTRAPMSMKWAIHPDYFHSGLETLVHFSTRAMPDADGLQMTAGRVTEVRFN
jgi:hypothetical protein